MSDNRFKVAKCQTGKQYACYHTQHNNTCQVIELTGKARRLVDDLYIKYLEEYRNKGYFDFVKEMIDGLKEIELIYNKKQGGEDE